MGDMSMWTVWRGGALGRLDVECVLSAHAGGCQACGDVDDALAAVETPTGTAVVCLSCAEARGVDLADAVTVEQPTDGDCAAEGREADLREAGAVEAGLAEDQGRDLEPTPDPTYDALVGGCLRPARWADYTSEQCDQIISRRRAAWRAGWESVAQVRA